MNIKTGTGTISLATLLAIYSISMVTSLPGLAISPILGDLETIFKGASDLELQLLESLPSFIIVPFILLAGKLSTHANKKRLLIIGLAIFFACSVVYPFANSLTLLLVVSALLGIGAGMVIPFSTGLIADYFTDEYRTRQLGISSSITNISLVLATFLAGILADINWHLPFLVYCLAGISLLFAFKLENRDPQIAPQIATSRKGGFTWPVGLMLFYYLITFLALTIPFNLSIHMEQLHIGEASTSGTLISIYFLAMTLPGFCINQLLARFGKNTNFLASALMTVGLLLFIPFRDVLALTVGVTLIGLGYGCMQPIIYDKTSRETEHPTYALALVMAMNYVAIVTYPFILQGLESLWDSHSTYFVYILNTLLCAAFTLLVYFRRGEGALGIPQNR